jgi:hypothetical protein
VVVAVAVVAEDDLLEVVFIGGPHEPSSHSGDVASSTVDAAAASSFFLRLTSGKRNCEIQFQSAPTAQKRTKMHETQTISVVCGESISRFLFFASHLLTRDRCERQESLA